MNPSQQRARYQSFKRMSVLPRYIISKVKNIITNVIVIPIKIGCAAINVSKFSEIGRPITLHNLFQAGSRQMGIGLSGLSLFIDLMDPYRETKEASDVGSLGSIVLELCPVSNAFCARKGYVSL